MAIFIYTTILFILLFIIVIVDRCYSRTISQELPSALGNLSPQGCKRGLPPVEKERWLCFYLLPSYELKWRGPLSPFSQDPVSPNPVGPLPNPNSNSPILIPDTQVFFSLCISPSKSWAGKG